MRKTFEEALSDLIAEYTKGARLEDYEEIVTALECATMDARQERNALSDGAEK